MKYFRTYPWGLQLLLFTLMAFTFMSSVLAIIGSLLPKFAGISAEQLGQINQNTPANIINATLIVAGVSNLFSWLLPAFVFAYLAHPKPLDYIGLRAPKKMIQPILAVLVMLGAMPVLEFIGTLMSHLPFSADVKASQKANEEMMNALLTMPSFVAFIKTFVVLSIIPAMGEEMFFRGVLMRFVRKKTGSMLFPVLFTALIFALAHSNPYGLLSIFLAGVLLAVIYYVTGSLWCSILAHLFFNGSQIILSYVGKGNAAVQGYMNNDSISYPLVIGGAVLFAVSFYLLLKTKTPLPDDWTEDFKDDSLTPARSEAEGEVE